MGLEAIAGRQVALHQPGKELAEQVLAIEEDDEVVRHHHAGHAERARGARYQRGHGVHQRRALLADQLEHRRGRARIGRSGAGRGHAQAGQRSGRGAGTNDRSAGSNRNVRVGRPGPPSSRYTSRTRRGCGASRRQRS